MAGNRVSSLVIRRIIRAPATEASSPISLHKPTTSARDRRIKLKLSFQSAFASLLSALKADTDLKVEILIRYPKFP